MLQLFRICYKDSSEEVHRAEVLQGREVLPEPEFGLTSWVSLQEGGCLQKGSHFLAPSAGCRHWALSEEGVAFGNLLPLKAVALLSTMPRAVEKAFSGLTGEEWGSTEHGGAQVSSELPDSGCCPLEDEVTQHQGLAWGQSTWGQSLAAPTLITHGSICLLSFSPGVPLLPESREHLGSFPA